MELQSFFGSKKGGVLGISLFIIVVLLSVVIYYVYNAYYYRYYINIYDEKTVDRVLEIPPFTERKTEPDRELIGECDLLIGTSFNQVKEFYSSFCIERGFEYKASADGFSIETRRGFFIEGKVVGGNILQIRWVPVLNSRQTVKCLKIFGKVKRPDTSEDD